MAACGFRPVRSLEGRQLFSPSPRLCSCRPRATRDVPASTSAQFPPYNVVHSGSGYFLRMYEPYPVVKAAYERRDEGFLMLGSYFSGENQEGVRFRETQPLVMCHSSKGPKTMELMVGDAKGMKSPAMPPLPLHPDLSLDISGGELLAAMTVKGNITPKVADAARRQLGDLLRGDGINLHEEATAGGFRVAQYGAIFSLDRLNEVILKVSL